MAGALGDRVNGLADEFNKSQTEYKVVPVYKGAYDEAMAAATAAYRAGNAPDILQVFEVGTATMMYSKGAIKPVSEVMKLAGEPFDPAKHEAIVSVESELASGSIIEEIERGYYLNGKLIRPSRVRLTSMGRM